MDVSYHQRQVFKMIKLEAVDILNKPWETQKAYSSALSGEVEWLTPKQFAQIFPITKKYNGNVLGEKDYYSVTTWISEYVGWDNKIPDRIEFLMEYLNRDVQLAVVRVMHILNVLHQRQTGEDVFTAWARANGIHIRHMDSD